MIRLTFGADPEYHTFGLRKRVLTKNRGPRDQLRSRKEVLS